MNCTVACGYRSQWEMWNDIRQLLMSKTVCTEKLTMPNARLIQWVFSWHYLDKFRNQDADVKSFHSLIARVSSTHLRCCWMTLHFSGFRRNVFRENCAVFLNHFHIGRICQCGVRCLRTRFPHSNHFISFGGRKNRLLNCNYNCTETMHRLRAHCVRDVY